MPKEESELKIKNEGSKKKYKAPALAKGLEILELLSGEVKPLTLSGISKRLDRSRSEIFRMVQELEECGYLRRVESGEGFELTTKLLLLGLEQPKTRTLLEAALPIMRDFANEVGQSCHLAVPVDDSIVVVARVEGPAPFGFAVRLGHKQIISQTPSGVSWLTFQPKEVRANLLVSLKEADTKSDFGKLENLINETEKVGYLKMKSQFVRGVTYFSVPVMSGDRAIAAMTCPFLSRLDDDGTKKLPVKFLKKTGREISSMLS